MKIFVVADSTDSWSGETELYAAFKTKKEALDFLESEYGIPPGLYDLFVNRHDDDIKAEDLQPFAEALEKAGRGMTVEEVMHLINCEGSNDAWDNLYGMEIKTVELHD